MKAKKIPVEVFAQGAAAFTSSADCLKEIVSAYTQYKTIAQQEQTKQRGIEAWEKMTVAQINAQREILMEYLDRSFDERAENFRAYFAVVDQAIASGNNGQLALTLNSLTELAKSSPFKDMANLASFQAALDDPNHVWTF